MSNNIRYFLYARKSSENEDRQMQSIEDQINVLQRLATSLNIQIVEVVEEAKSAKEPGQRPVFNSLLERIGRGEADGLLCWSINRLFRNQVDYAAVAWLLQQGIIKSIRTVDREYLPVDNVLLLAIEAGFATQYSIDLSKNVKRGIHEKALRGMYPNKPPHGYKTVEAVIGQKLAHGIEVDLERFELMRQAWEKMLTGAYTVPRIFEFLESKGFKSIKTKRGLSSPIARSSLYRLFKNPFYYGYFWFGGVLYHGTHQPMVTKAEFDRVQALLQRNGPTRPQHHQFAFTGLIRCGICNCGITAERKVKRSGKTYTYYHCTGKRGCPANSVSESYLETSIWALFDSLKLDPPVARLGVELVSKEKLTNVDDPGAILLHSTIMSLRRKMERIYEMRENGELSSKEFSERKGRVQTEIIQLEEEVTSQGMRFESNRKALRSAFELLSHSDMVHAPLDTKRQVASLLADEYVLTQGKLHIRPNSLLLKIRRLEPPKEGDLQVQDEQNVLTSSIVRRWWNDVRTLLTGSETWSIGGVSVQDGSKIPRI